MPQQSRTLGDILAALDYGDTVRITYEPRVDEENRTWDIEGTVENVHQEKSADGVIQVRIQETGSEPSHQRDIWYVMAEYDPDSGWSDNIGLWYQPPFRDGTYEPFSYTEHFTVTDIEPVT